MIKTKTKHFTLPVLGLLTAALVFNGSTALAAPINVTGNPATDTGWTAFGNSMEDGVYVTGAANYSYHAYSAGLTIQAGSNLDITDGSFSWLPGDTVLGVGGKFEPITAAEAGWSFTGDPVNSRFHDPASGPRLQVKFGTSDATWVTSTAAPASGNGNSSSSAGGGRVQVRTSSFFTTGTPLAGQTEPWTWDGNSGQLLVLDKETHILWAGDSNLDKRVARMIWIWDAGTDQVSSWQLLLNVSLLESLYPGFTGLLPAVGDLAVLTVQDRNSAFTDALVNIVQLPVIPALTCLGFEAPLDKLVVVKKANRVLPLRMTLVDGDGAMVSSITPPVVSIYYAGNYYADGKYAEELNYAGKGDDGNQFVFNGTFWAFNLSTKGLAPGTYTITAVSGNDSEYVIDPTCAAVVEIE